MTIGPSTLPPFSPADAVDADTASVLETSSVDGLVVHAYTRAEALADGVLVDVTREASPAEMVGRFRVPVAVTAALWSAIQAIPERLAGLADVRGRLHDVLWMASLACRRGRGSSASALFAAILPCRGARKRVQTLRVDVGPDDVGAACVTIGFPEDF